MKNKFQFMALVLLGIMLSINQMWGAVANVAVDALSVSSSPFSVSCTANGGTNPAARTDFSDPNPNYVRLYANNKVTISTTGNDPMTQIVITWSRNTGKPWASASVTTGDGSYTDPDDPGTTSGVTVTGTWTGSAKTVVFTLGDAGQKQIHSVSITTGGGSTYTDYITECAEPTACATPTFTPAAGTHSGAQSVTISCSTPGATIHYTTDGTTPTSSSATYSSTISVNQDKTLKAIAIKDGLTDSEVATAAYVINYTVTFNMKGHGTAPSALTTVKYNTNINSSKPADPSVAGYNFDGWYKEDACTNAWNWSTDRVTSNTTLYAKWTPITYTITYYNLNGASNSNPTSYTKETATINFADPGARDGYRFDGWYDNSSFTGSKVTTLAKGTTTGDKEYWAKWTERYTITWNNYGDESVKTYVWAGETIASLPDDPSGDCLNGGKHYDDFKCWYKEEITDPVSSLTDSKKVTSETIPTGDVTYYAVYTDLTDPGNVFTRITSPSAIVDGMDVVIAHSSGALQLNSGLKVATLPAESNNQITVTDTKMIWTVGESGSYFTLTNGTSKLGAASIPNSNNSAAVTASATPTKYQWSFAAHNTSNTLLIKMESSNAALEYYSSAWKIYNNSGVASNADCALKVYGRQFVDGKYLTSCCPQIAITYDNSIAHGRVSGPTGGCDGATVTLTATPDDGYRLQNWDVYKTGEPATKVTVTTNQITMPSYPITVSATFEEIPGLQKDYYVDDVYGLTVDKSSAAIGTKIGTYSMPILADQLGQADHQYFRGWVTQANCEAGTLSSPIAGGTSQTANGTTYYAVWADRSSNGTYNIPLSAYGEVGHDIEDGKYALMCYDNDWNEYWVKTSTGDITYVAGFVTESNLTGTENYIWNITKATGYKLQSANNSRYADLNSADVTMYTSATTPTEWSMDYNGGTATWTIYTGTRAWVINTGKSTFDAGSGTLASATAFYLYKLEENVNYSDPICQPKADGPYSITKIETEATIAIAGDLTEAHNGDEVSFIVSAIPGYTFSSVKVYKGDDVDNVVALVNDNNTYRFTMPASDVTILPECTCNLYRVTTELKRHATLGGIGTYVQVVNNTASSATCGATLGEYSFGIQFKNDTYRSLYHINVSATRGGSPWASGPSSWSFENEIFTMKEGTLTGNVVVSVTLTEDEYTVTTKTAPKTGLATITLYKLDGSTWGSTIPAGQTVYLDAAPISGYVFDPYDNWKVGKALNESQDAAEVRGPASAGANNGRYYFTMPKEDVVVIATIANTAQDTYIDEMHDNVIDPATTRNNYTVPLLSDDSGGTVDCEQEHLYFVGWSKTSTGVGASSAPGDIIAGGISKTADGSTYYAVWATAVH